jgi:hypothetical protein
MSRFAQRLAVVVLLLLVYAFTRLHHLTALPLFVDEGFHLDAAERVFDGEFIGPGMGYLLHVWVNAYLGPEPPTAVWATRAGTVLAGLLGLAGIYALGRQFVSFRAGIIAMLLWIAAPPLLFFERMALADPLLTPLSVLAVWVAWLMVRSQRVLFAVILSGMVALVILAKASGIVWLPLPLIAVLAAPALSWQQRLRLGAISYGVFALFYVPFLVFLKVRGFSYQWYVGRMPSHLGGLDLDLLDRVPRNLENAWKIDVTYLGLPVIGLAILGGLYWLRHKPHPAWFTLLVLGIAASGPILFGLNVNSRYMLNHVPWVLLALACGAGLFIERYRQANGPVFAAVGLWSIVFFVPFLLDAWNDPADLRLNRDDRNAYISLESSGYGTTQIGEWLRTSSDPLPVIGLVANCQPLRHAAYPLTVLCPEIHWDGTSQRELMILVQRQAARSPVYVVGEQLSYINLKRLPKPYTVLQTVQRPGSQNPIILYRIEQGAKRQSNQ